MRPNQSRFPQKPNQKSQQKPKIAKKCDIVWVPKGDDPNWMSIQAIEPATGKILASEDYLGNKPLTGFYMDRAHAKISQWVIDNGYELIQNTEGK